jgi:hypothetical protein
VEKVFTDLFLFPLQILFIRKLRCGGGLLSNREGLQSKRVSRGKLNCSLKSLIPTSESLIFQLRSKFDSN